MSVKTLQGYMALCRHYGWKPSWEGLHAFNRGERKKVLQNAKLL